MASIGLIPGLTALGGKKISHSLCGAAMGGSGRPPTSLYYAWGLLCADFSWPWVISAPWGNVLLLTILPAPGLMATDKEYPHISRTT